LAISVSRAALQRNYAFFERQKRWAGIEPHDAVATFAGRTVVPASVRTEPFWRHNYAANQLLLSSYHLAPDTVDAYIAGLAKFGPRLIDSYPSSLEPIARRIIERGDRPVRPAAIITSSETLDPAVRALFANAFNCQVFDHYGSAEMVAFITQCSHGGYHVNPEYGILELLDDSGAPVADGQIGEIVATGFINHAMPLIRYRMGDSARMAAVPCTCGSAFPHVEAILGRTDDVIVTPDGRRVGRIDPIFKAVTSLHEARVVQTALDHVRLELVVGAGFRDADREDLITGLRSRLGPYVNVECIEVPKIPRTQGGKLRTVVSLLNAHAPTERP
jgi:phenylacetate-CoA ligase